MRAYREWLPANCWEGAGSLGGSFNSDDISEYYLTQREVGYGRLVNLDHDDDRTVGLSRLAAYTSNEREVLSLGVGDDDSEIGTEPTLAWGEQDSGSAKLQVQRHAQTDIRETVSGVPYGDGCNK